MSDPNASVLDDGSFLSESTTLPELYSPSAIKGFGFLFSTLFGGVLLSMNLKRIGKEKDIPAVMAISIGYFLFTILIQMHINLKSGLSIGVNFAGALFLSTVIWDKYLGKNIGYTKRKILIPLIIGLALAALIVIGIFNSRDSLSF
jgi:hypothetical protein